MMSANAGCIRRPQPEQPQQSAGTARTKESARQPAVSARLSFGQGNTFGFAVADDGNGIVVYDAQGRKRLGELPFPEEYAGIGLAREKPYTLRDISGDGLPELRLLLADGSVLYYQYQPDRDSKPPFTVVWPQEPTALSVLQHSTLPAALSTVAYPYRYTATQTLTGAQKELYQTVQPAVLALEPWRYDARTYGYDTL
ncbi:MAG: hypothetical protein PHO66_04595, partial [Eubacteriales bacterium]|nr:hypothetical protein [Eubacteriales bacterium]